MHFKSLKLLDFLVAKLRQKSSLIIAKNSKLKGRKQELLSFLEISNKNKLSLKSLKLIQKFLITLLLLWLDLALYKCKLQSGLHYFLP